MRSAAGPFGGAEQSTDQLENCAQDVNQARVSIRPAQAEARRELGSRVLTSRRAPCSPADVSRDESSKMLGRISVVSAICPMILSPRQACAAPMTASVTNAPMQSAAGELDAHVSENRRRPSSSPSARRCRGLIVKGPSERLTSRPARVTCQQNAEGRQRSARRQPRRRAQRASRSDQLDITHVGAAAACGPSTRRGGTACKSACTRVRRHRSGAHAAAILRRQSSSANPLCARET